MAAGESTTPVSRRLATSITAHAWNADGTMLAISPNLPEVWIYVNCTERATSKWEKKYVLAKVSTKSAGAVQLHKPARHPAGATARRLGSPAACNVPPVLYPLHPGWLARARARLSPPRSTTCW